MGKVEWQPFSIKPVVVVFVLILILLPSVFFRELGIAASNLCVLVKVFM